MDQAKQDQVAGVIARQSRRLRMVRFGDARDRPRLLVPSPNHGSQSEACSLEKKEAQRRKVLDRPRRDEEVVGRWPRQGDSVP